MLAGALEREVGTVVGGARIVLSQAVSRTVSTGSLPQPVAQRAAGRWLCPGGILGIVVTSCGVD
jgi:hypothetical protein